jgi:hypothetical protein
MTLGEPRKSIDQENGHAIEKLTGSVLVMPI